MNMNGWQNWLANNIKWVAGTLVLLVVVLGGYGVVKERERSREREASNLLYNLRRETTKDVNVRAFDQAIEKLKPIFDKFPKSRAAFDARLMIGDIWMDAGNNQKAAEAYQVAFNSAPDLFSRFLAKYNEALALEAGKEFGKAEAAYNEALNVKGTDFLRPEILMAKARCLEAQKRFSEARSVYLEVRDKFSSNGFYAAAATAFLGDLPQ